jgi:HlyD family secretion protein
MSRRIGLLVVVLLALAAGAFWFSQRDADGNGPLLLYGNVDIREVELAFRQPGRLARMAVDEGDAVKAGDVLAELDPQPYRDAMAAVVAEVQRAQAEFDKLQQGFRPQEIAQSRQAQLQAEAAFRNAEAEYLRQRELAKAGLTSQRLLEAAQSTRDQAAAALGAARAALGLQREGYRSEDIAAAAARLAAAEAARSQAQTSLDDTRLVAPADATVLARVREPGSMLDPRAAVYTLSLRDPVYVRAYVSEPDLGRLVPGARVTIRTDSSDREYVGQVGFISPRAEFTPKSVETTDLRTDLVYRLRIVVADADDGLRQGMPVTIRVDVADPR